MESKNLNLAGKLLVAMPGMGDLRFSHSVVYISTHSEDGAMGLIINKPSTDLDLNDLLKQLSFTPKNPISLKNIHIGGPVEYGRGFVLHSRDYQAKDATLNVTEDIGMTASLEILEDISQGDGPIKSLLALGYSGWGPGQLENEIQANGWLISETPEDFLFSMDDDQKWNAALNHIGVDPRMLSAKGGNA